MFEQQQKPLEEEKKNYKKNYKPRYRNYKKNYKKPIEIEISKEQEQAELEHQKQLDQQKQLQERCKDHDYVRTDGITTCSICPFYSIKYLTPLKTKNKFN